MSLILIIYQMFTKWITNRISALDNNTKFQDITDLYVIRNEAGVILLYKSKNCSENVIENINDYDLISAKY